MRFEQIYGYKGFSQNGEQGVISEVLKRIGKSVGISVEFGAPNEKFCSNTYFLKERGWVTHFYDINPQSESVEKREITPENVNDLPRCNVLSIDVDGGDYEIWKAYNHRPDIVIIEIDSSIEPWKKEFNSNGGASFYAMLSLGIRKGYFLLCHTGNMIFTKEEFIHLFPEVNIICNLGKFNYGWLPQHNLLDTTFIIPIRIESEDRKFNYEWVMNFLLSNFMTNIIVYESDKEQKAKRDFNNHFGSEVKYLFEETDNDIFHRTRLLNEMLVLSKTPVTVNYDADVFLKPEQYLKARDLILSGVDLLYPFGKGVTQVMVKRHEGDLFDTKFHHPWQSLAGHCQFFNTDVYKRGFMENEEFISYGAEDRERMERFIKLDFRVEWMDGQVYHIEHSRGKNSSSSNPHFKANSDLYKKLLAMNREELCEYYHNVEYLKKY